MEKIVCPVKGCKKKLKKEAHLKSHMRQKHPPATNPATTVFGSAPSKDPEGNLRRAREELGIEEERPVEVTQPLVGSPVQGGGGHAPIGVTAASGLIKIPFALWASMSGCKGLALNDDEERELGEYAKAVIDKYGPEWMMRYMGIINLSVALVSVTSGKLMVYNAHRQEQAARKKQQEEVSGNAGNTESREERPSVVLPKSSAA